MPGPEDDIEADIGGVQGTPDDTAVDGDDQAAWTDGGTPVTAPDAGEIEWAGGLIEQAPRAP